MSGDQEPWVIRGGLTSELQVSSVYLYALLFCVVSVFVIYLVS